MREIEKEDYALLWDEYKYRHDLIWKHLVRSTLAVIALLFMPYSTEYNNNNTFNLGAPVIAVIYLIFTLFVICREIELLEGIKRIHRKRQYQLYELHKSIFDTDQNKIPNDQSESVDDYKCRKNGFKTRVIFYLGFLIVLAIVMSIVNICSFIGSGM